MKKVKIVVAYDGTDFSGFQKQPGMRTVQGTLEETLFRLTGERIEIHGSGRTDAGVHALGQVCHFTTHHPIPPDKYAYILRRMLPNDLIVYSSEEVPLDFHARKSAHWKTYRYQITTRLVPNLFTRRFRTHWPEKVNLDRMKEAADYLIGTHDFTSFCSPKTPIEDKVRTLYQLDIYPDDEGYILEVTGNGFLYNMVRILVGTLVQVGKGRLHPSEIETILEAKDRQTAGPTAPPEGLILLEVGYAPWK
jgi:tRNA pseudouridine38-40 synthase